jgi:hypothetical protein
VFSNKSTKDVSADVYWISSDDKIVQLSPIARKDCSPQTKSHNGPLPEQKFCFAELLCAPGRRTIRRSALLKSSFRGRQPAGADGFEGLVTLFANTAAATVFPNIERGSAMGLILLIILVLLLFGSVPAWPHARNWGYGPSGLLGLFLVVLLVLLLLDRFPGGWWF